MKTTNSAQKTEKRPFGKSAILISTLLLSLVLHGNTASAGAFGNHFPFDNSKAHKFFVIESRLAMGHLLMPDAYLAEIFHTANVSYLETSTDKSLEIEKWMTNEKYFASPLPSVESEMEESLMVEAWMLMGEIFLESAITEENDKAMQIEKWMLDASRWVN